MPRLLYNEATQFCKALEDEIKKLEGCKDADIIENISDDREYGGALAGENFEIDTKFINMGIKISYYGEFPSDIYAVSPKENANKEIEGITVYMTNMITINDPTGKCKEHFYAGSKEVLVAITPFINKKIKMIIEYCQAAVDKKNKAEKDKRYQTYLKLKEEFEKE